MNDTDRNPLNPVALWREWIVKSEAQWSESLSHLLKDEKAGGVLNRQLDEMQMAHRQFSEFAQASLAAANLPSRSDLEALDERMGRLEDGLAQVAAAVSQLGSALTAAGVAAPAAKTPTRDRTAKTPTRNRAAKSPTRNPAPKKP